MANVLPFSGCARESPMGAVDGTVGGGDEAPNGFIDF